MSRIDGLCVCSLIPLVSTPFGICHTIFGLASAAIRLYGVANSFFSCCKENSFGSALKCGVWIREEDKKSLHKSIQTIVLGLLEMVPVIGNLGILGIYLSKWGYASFLEKKLEQWRLKQEWAIQEQEREFQKTEGRLLQEKEALERKAQELEIEVGMYRSSVEELHNELEDWERRWGDLFNENSRLKNLLLKKSKDSSPVRRRLHFIPESPF